MSFEICLYLLCTFLPILLCRKDQAQSVWIKSLGEYQLSNFAPDFFFIWFRCRFYSRIWLHWSLRCPFLFSTTWCSYYYVSLCVGVFMFIWTWHAIVFKILHVKKHWPWVYYLTIKYNDFCRYNIRIMDVAGNEIKPLSLQASSEASIIEIEMMSRDFNPFL